MTRVSVITPAHNSEAYLAEALRSVEAQTFTDWEVVVADDASSDGTVAVAEVDLDKREHWHSLGDFKAQIPSHRPPWVLSDKR